MLKSLFGTLLILGLYNQAGYSQQILCFCPHYYYYPTTADPNDPWVYLGLRHDFDRDSEDCDNPIPEYVFDVSPYGSIMTCVEPDCGCFPCYFGCRPVDESSQTTPTPDDNLSDVAEPDNLEESNNAKVYPDLTLKTESTSLVHKDLIKIGFTVGNELLVKGMMTKPGEERTMKYFKIAVSETPEGRSIGLGNEVLEEDLTEEEKGNAKLTNLMAKRMRRVINEGRLEYYPSVYMIRFGITPYIVRTY